MSFAPPQLARAAHAAAVTLAVAATFAVCAPAAQAAVPHCDPLALPPVHSGGATTGTLVCDAAGDQLDYAVDEQPTRGFASSDGFGGFTYYADSDKKGPDSFTVSVQDQYTGEETVATVTVQVTNAVPTCKGVSLGAIAPGATANGTPDCSDTDQGDSSRLTYAIASQPTGGTASINSGSIYYTPRPGFSGTDSFTYTARDGVDTSAPATVTVSVVNHAPVCEGSSPTLRTGKPLTSPPDPCYDVDGQSVQLSIGQDAAHGHAVANANGTWTYTPNAGYTGADHFTIVASDGTANSAPANVDLTVTPNHAPVCEMSAVQTGVGAAVTVVLYCSDQDAQDKTHLTYALSNPSPAHGAISTLNGNAQTLKYTPNSGYAGTDSFGFTASDGDLTGSATQIIHVSNSPVCDPPAAQTVRLGRTFSAQLQCTEPPNNPGTLTYSIVSPPSRGTATIDSTGGVIRYTAPATGPGDGSFTVKVHSSTAGDSNVVTQVVTVDAAANAAPQCSPGGTVDVVAGRQSPLYPFCSDSDGDPVTLHTNGSPAHGTAVVDGNALKYTAAEGYSGPDSVPFSASDGHGGTTTGAMAVNVRVNQAPTASIDGPATALLGHAVTLTGSDGDADGSVVGRAWDTDADGQFDDGTGASVSPSFDSPGAHVVRYRVLDNDGTSTTATKTITVTREDAPADGGNAGDPHDTPGTAEATGTPQGPGTPGTPSAPGTPDTPRPGADTTPPSGRVLVLKGQKLRTVLKRGLKTSVKLDEPSSVRIVLSLNKKTAKKLKLPVIVGSLTKSASPGSATYTVRLSKKAAKKLKSLRSVPLGLVVTAKDTAGNVFTKTLAVRLKR
jgi:Big-like domain-containing protein/PKD domain-containing protein